MADDEINKNLSLSEDLRRLLRTNPLDTESCQVQERILRSFYKTIHHPAIPEKLTPKILDDWVRLLLEVAKRHTEEAVPNMNEFEIWIETDVHWQREKWSLKIISRLFDLVGKSTSLNSFADYYYYRFIDSIVLTIKNLMRLYESRGCVPLFIIRQAVNILIKIETNSVSRERHNGCHMPFVMKDFILVDLRDEYVLERQNEAYYKTVLRLVKVLCANRNEVLEIAWQHIKLKLKRQEKFTYDPIRINVFPDILENISDSLLKEQSYREELVFLFKDWVFPRIIFDHSYSSNYKAYEVLAAFTKDDAWIPFRIEHAMGRVLNSVAEFAKYRKDQYFDYKDINERTGLFFLNIPDFPKSLWRCLLALLNTRKGANYIRSSAWIKYRRLTFDVILQFGITWRESLREPADLLPYRVLKKLIEIAPKMPVRVAKELFRLLKNKFRNIWTNASKEAISPYRWIEKDDHDAIFWSSVIVLRAMNVLLVNSDKYTIASLSPNVSETIELITSESSSKVLLKEADEMRKSLINVSETDNSFSKQE